MIRIIDGRGTGKTSRLMLMAKEKSLPIACINPITLRDKARAYGITGIDFISYKEANEKENREFLVDDLLSFAQYFTRGKIEGYTLSNN